MKLNRRQFLQGAASAAALGLLAPQQLRRARRALAQGNTAPTVDTDTIVIVRGDMATARDLSPINSWARRMYDIGWNVWDGMMDWTGDARTVVPRLATAWSASEDGITWTFTLRDDVTWHDGEPFTAEDVEFTIRGIQQPESTFGNKASVDLVTGINIVDDFTIELSTDSPVATLANDLSRMGIAPKHLLEGQDLLNNDFNSLPVGTGPYRAVERNGDDVTLEAYENYYLPDLPRTNRLIYRSIPEMASIAAALRAGEVDIAPFDFATMEGIEEDGFQVYLVPALTFDYMVINHENPLFENKLVRQALSHALDRDAIVEIALNGLATPATSPISTTNPLYTPDVREYPFDMDQTAALMQEAGWTMNDSGMWERDGETFSFSILAGTNDVAIVAQQNWQQAGFDVQLEQVNDGALRSERWRSSDFDIAAMASGNGLDPIANPYPIWYGTDAEFNWSQWTNSDFDALWDNARGIFDAEERIAANHDAQRTLAEELPWFYIAHRQHGYVAKPGLEGVVLNEWDWAVGMETWFWNL